jgi:uncharacterized protein
VTAFGLTTAATYAASGLVDWRLVLMFVIGGLAGSLFGGQLSTRLAPQKQLLSQLFAGIVAAVGIYVVARGLLA